MFLQTISCTLIFAVAVFLAVPLGRYLSRIYKEERSPLDFLQPLENRLYRFCRINAQAGMNWKQYLSAILMINGIWFAWAMLILLFQGKFLLNPAHNPSMDWSLPLNSAISFLTSTNLQHYAGESGATYLSQMTVFMFLQFVSAATSLAAGIAVARGLGAGTTSDLGNFYKDFVRSLTRVLLPLSLIVAIVFAFNGMPMTFRGPEKIYPVQGDAVQVATGPVAAMIPIKELGSNGGGFFAANDAHPFENPNFVTFAIHIIIVLLLPIAFVFCVGRYLQSKQFSRMLFVAMTAGFLLVTIPIVVQEMKGNPALVAMGLNTREGNMEGKELRFGSFYSAFYSGVNRIVPAGTLVGSHDSYMPLGGATMLAGMHIDAFYGGLGTGWINMFLYLIIAVFIATLMIGRTPIAGGLREKKATPYTSGSLSVNSMTFGAFLFIVIIFLNALSFLPAFMLGPLAEHLSLHGGKAISP